MASKKISVSCVWICVIGLLIHVNAQEKENVFGIYGKSTTLKCPLQPTSEIEWYNWVYNLAGDAPAFVYKDGKLNDDEYHVGRFTVNPDTLDLTIADLNEDDVGTYFCQTSEQNKYYFELSLGGKLECYGHVEDLRQEEETKLDCTMDYTGTAPKMQWLHGEEVLGSDDHTGIGSAKHTLDVTADYKLDKQEYVCRVIVGDMVEDCPLTFDIKYAVRDLTITPEQDAYGPGSEFVCSALGNPTVEVTVTLPDGEIKKAENRVKVVIPNEWEGMTKSVFCEAKNLLDGMPHSVSNNFTFEVSAKAAPEQGESEGEDGSEPKVKNTQMIGIIAGIVIGAVVLVIIIIAVVCIKKRQSKPPKGSKQVSTKDDNDVKA